MLLCYSVEIKSIIDCRKRVLGPAVRFVPNVGFNLDGAWALPYIIA
jgi:hypothetical protein